MVLPVKTKYRLRQFLPEALLQQRQSRLFWWYFTEDSSFRKASTVRAQKSCKILLDSQLEVAINDLAASATKFAEIGLKLFLLANFV